MNKLQLFLSLLLFSILAVSCGSTMDAVEEGKKFHEAYNAGEFQMLANMSYNSEKVEDALGFYQVMNETYGDFKSFKKTGFHSSINNGITKVVLNYTVEFENFEGKFYEQISFIKDGEVVKISGYNINKDKSKLPE